MLTPHPHSTRQIAASDASKKSSHALENERALNALLRTVTNRASLEAILLECLDILLAVSWLSVLPKGGVFLVQDEADTLHLVAQRGLSSELLTLCARVPFGTCLCGRAAAQRQMVHAPCIDPRHDIRFDEMKPHGHYSVPILDGGNVVGVMVLYLPHGHGAKKREAQFLAAVADILSLVIRQKRVEEDLKDAVAKLEKMALIDYLTDLYNRRYLIDQLHKEFEEARRRKEPLSVVMIDMDLFKHINDNYGHAVGDRALCQAARIISENVRTHDVAARFGGEEFCLVLPRTRLCDAAQIAERVRYTIEVSSVSLSGDGSIRFTASMGVAELTHTETLEQGLARADAALYAAKRRGRNRVEQADTPGSHDHGRARLDDSELVNRCAASSPA